MYDAPNPDLEAPYQFSCRLAEKYRELPEYLVSALLDTARFAFDRFPGDSHSRIMLRRTLFDAMLTHAEVELDKVVKVGTADLKEKLDYRMRYLDFNRDDSRDGVIEALEDILAVYRQRLRDQQED